MVFDETNFWQAVSFLGLMLHVIHAPRMPNFYAKRLQSKGNRFNIPNWVFWVVWITVLCCDAAFGVLFFMDKTDFNSYYQAAAWVYLINVLLMLEWNWLYFNVICFYAVGLVGVFIFLAHAALLTLVLLYGGQHWFTILIICVPIAWTVFAAIGSVYLAVREGPQLKNYKKEVGEMSDYVYNDAAVKTGNEKLPPPPPPATTSSSTPPLTSENRFRGRDRAHFN